MGGRRNKRKKSRMLTLSWEEELKEKLGLSRFEGRCAYCGAPLRPGQWHWMYDEFGQRVRKCNDERACQKNRRPECEDSFRKAMRM